MKVPVAKVSSTSTTLTSMRAAEMLPSKEKTLIGASF